METLSDLGAEYQERFASMAPYRDSVWRVLVRRVFQSYVDPRLDGTGPGLRMGRVYTKHTCTSADRNGS